MTRYQFFVQDNSVTFLDTGCADYPHAGRQLLAAGFVAQGSPLEATDPTAALQAFYRLPLAAPSRPLIRSPYALLMAA